MQKKYIDIDMNKQNLDKFCERGFFILSQNSNVELPEYIKAWNKVDLQGFSIHIHPRQMLFYKSIQNETYFLIGHAYNPFTNTISEDVILEEWVNADKENQTASFDYINSITGLFILGKISQRHISIVLDCSGMMSGYYGVLDNSIIITSHTVIASELFGLEPTSYVKKLLGYKFYHLYGSFLPGDITPYENVFRVVPNTEVTIDILTLNTKINRFYPNRNIDRITNEEDYKKQIEMIVDVFQKSMSLIARKWSNPAISLTGGMDSKTTLAAANGLYNKFTYFTYITSKAEKIDADAAKNICEAIGVKHKTYDISPNPESYPNFTLTKNILQYNKDYIGKNNTNDICKREFFSNVQYFDVEVKSWVSEIARANYYKKYGKKKMPRHITPRRCSSMYKIFLHNRKLLKETDKVFSNYISKTQLKDKIHNLDWSDLFLWEIRYGSWGGLVITAEHKYSFDITIPYNNRKLLELMLAVPLEKRRKDILHNDLIKRMNSKIFDTGINVVNLNETKFREICEKIYFNINTYLPF